MIQVYKFGGSSIKDINGYKRVVDIIQQQAEGKLVVVLSAMGKTTNALEKVMKFLDNHDQEKAELELERIRQYHLDVVYDLELDDSCIAKINRIFDSFADRVQSNYKDYDELYDRVICLGEQSSSTILTCLLEREKIKVALVNAIDLIATNEIHRDATVNWELTQDQVEQVLIPIFDDQDVVITQGFLGGHSGVPTTLGREGSDYSAAILSYVLNVESLSIWKDVPGIMSGDPREFDNVLKIDRLSYREATEMTYYGAKVLHPKTIKPLQNKGILLRVRPFLNPEEEGTSITTDVEVAYPPIVVVEKNQCMLHISTKDFSFVAEHHMRIIFNMISDHRIKVNMMRNTAISFTVCLSHRGSRVFDLMEALQDQFKVVLDDDLELITIRHGQDFAVPEIVGNRIVIFEERIRDTIQMVVRRSPGMRRKNS